jgi:hypothetical protein
LSGKRLSNKRSKSEREEEEEGEGKWNKTKNNYQSNREIKVKSSIQEWLNFKLDIHYQQKKIRF